MNSKIKVLFLCIHNSARSQMAEAYLKKYGGEKFHVESAGLESGKLNPFAVRAMMEEGIDISNNPTQLADDLVHDNRSFDFVITVCDEASAERCPIFPGKHTKLHWSFADPSSYKGSDEEKLNFTRGVRDEIRSAIKKFLMEMNYSR